MSEHATLSPSGAHRWMACPGSLALESKLPDSTSSFAEEGTQAHALAAQCLALDEHPIDYDNCAIDYDDHGVKKCVAIGREMAEFVQVYVDAIHDYAEGGELMVEQRLEFSRYVDVPGQFGTSDAVILLGDEIQVHDLKYGRGVKVDADANEQLMLYALGALDTFGPLGDFKTVRLVIHQPRLQHLSEWSCTVEHLLSFADRAKVAAQGAMDVLTHGALNIRNVLTPGESQCRFCKAKGTCPALQDKVLATVAGEFEVVFESPVVDTLKKDEIAVSITEAERIVAAAHGVAPKAVDYATGEGLDVPYFIVKKPSIRPALEQPEDRIAALDGDHLATCMDAVDLVEGWCKAVRAETERRMLAGTPVPGWKLVTGKAGNRSWTDPAEAEKLLKSFRCKQDEMYDFTLISPTSAEKLLAEASPKRWAKAQSLIGRSDGRPSVAPASDKRPALVITAVADDFDAVEAPAPAATPEPMKRERLVPEAAWPFPNAQPGSPAAKYNAQLAAEQETRDDLENMEHDQIAAGEPFETADDLV